MKALKSIALGLLIIGGLNWLLFALMPSWAIGMWLPSGIANIIYILVGLAALYKLFVCWGHMQKGGSMM